MEKDKKNNHIISKLAKKIKGYWLSTILTPLFVSLEVIMEVIIPTVMGKMIDYGIQGNDFNKTVQYGIILVGLCVLSLIFGVASGYNCAISSAGFAKNLRRDMYVNVQKFSFSNIDKFSTASLVTRLTTDVTNVQNSFQMLTRIAVRCPLMLVTALVMSFAINKDLSCVFLFTIPFLGLALGFVIVKAMPVFKKLFEKYDELNNTVQENLHGIRVVKSFVREDYEYNNKFKKKSGDIRNLSVTAEMFLSINQPAMMAAVYASMLMISWLGAKLIVSTGETAFTIGNLQTLIQYVMQILMSCMMLSMIFVMMTMSAASAKRVVEVLDEESDINSPENAVKDVKDGSIEFSDACFSYSKNPDNLCIKHINLNIKSGMTVGIIGATGSAKSSFVQLIPRLYDLTSGELKVGGVNVKDYDLTVLRDSVSMVLQKNELFEGTISENLRWGNEKATDEEVKRAAVLACADEFIETFPDKYNTHIEQGGTNVSGGQKQRLCIARALLKKPKILILDDSTSAVDTNTDAKIRHAFKTEIPDTTKLIIAQRISSVQDSDMIVVLDNGEVNAYGTHEELLETNDIYKEVYYSQVKGGDEE